MMGFFVSGALVLALAAPAWAADTGSAARHGPAGEAAGGPGISPAGAVSGQYEANRHGSDRDRYHRDGRWYYRDGHWYYYRDGRWYRDDGRHYYRDGRHYRDGYYRDGRYRYDHPRGGHRYCESGEWAYHPNTGWMCVG